MAYVTQVQLENAISEEKLRQLTDDDGDGISDTGVLNDAIADSDATVDAHLAAKYSVPFSSPPAVVTALSKAIAIFTLFQRRTGEAPEDIRKRYDDAIKFLQSVQEGEGVIAGATSLSGVFVADRDFEDDRDFRLPWEGGSTDSEKAGTFGTFDDNF